jgi:hypothetical protein
LRGDAISPLGSTLVQIWFVFPTRRIKVLYSRELSPIALPIAVIDNDGHQIGGQWRREKIGLMGPSLGVDEARRRAVLMMGSVSATSRPSSRPRAATR